MFSFIEAHQPRCLMLRFSSSLSCTVGGSMGPESTSGCPLCQAGTGPCRLCGSPLLILSSSAFTDEFYTSWFWLAML